MGFLQDKKILITGLLSNRSIAYGIAKACHREGAQLAFTYVNDKLKDRVVDLAAEFGSDLVLRCDVANDDDITQVFEQLAQQWDGLDGFVHAIAFAPRESLEGDFLDSLSREAFQVAHDISSYSFPALAKAARPMMRGRNGACLTLSYLGAVRAIPHYNVMGLAKASLEASVRYLAEALGPKGMRVNGISAGMAAPALDLQSMAPKQPPSGTPRPVKAVLHAGGSSSQLPDAKPLRQVTPSTSRYCSRCSLTPRVNAG